MYHPFIRTLSLFTDSPNLTKFVKFFDSYFLIKDPITGVQLLRGNCVEGVYPLPGPAPNKLICSALAAGTRTSLDALHNRLGHPSLKIIQYLLSRKFIPLSFTKNSSTCISCHINKSHRLPFSKTLLSSQSPLEYLYADQMYGVLLQLLLSMDSDTMFYLWIILPNIVGYFPCITNQMWLLFFNDSSLSLNVN